MIYLYVKKCTHCNKRYFGKTYSKNPYSYSGSGLHWRRHLKHHNSSFETIEVWSFISQKEATDFAESYSMQNNIVELDEWFNLIVENALDGNPIGNIPWNKGKQSNLKGMTYEEIHGQETAQNLKMLRSLSNKRRGPRSDETKAKISETRKNRIKDGTIAKVCPPLRPQNLEKANERVECPHCHKIGSRSNMKRWHFDKCKFLS